MTRSHLLATVLFLSTLALASQRGRLALRESFDSQPEGWTLGPEWETGPAKGSPGDGLGNGDPDRDATEGNANGVAGVRLGGNATNSAHQEFFWLTSPAVDGGYGRGLLRFQRWLNSDRSPYMNNRIEVWDGRIWLPVWESGGQIFSDKTWQPVEIDVSEHLNRQFRVRFGFVRHPGAMNSSSWNIDDVSVEVWDAPAPVTALLSTGSLAGLAVILLVAAFIPFWVSKRA